MEPSLRRKQYCSYLRHNWLAIRTLDILERHTDALVGVSRAVAVRCPRQLDVGSINELYLIESFYERSVLQAPDIQ